MYSFELRLWFYSTESIIDLHFWSLIVRESFAIANSEKIYLHLSWCFHSNAVKKGQRRRRRWEEQYWARPCARDHIEYEGMSFHQETRNMNVPFFSFSWLILRNISSQRHIFFIDVLLFVPQSRFIHLSFFAIQTARRFWTYCFIIIFLLRIFGRLVVICILLLVRAQRQSRHRSMIANRVYDPYISLLSDRHLFVWPRYTDCDHRRRRCSCSGTTLDQSGHDGQVFLEASLWLSKATRALFSGNFHHGISDWSSLLCQFSDWRTLAVWIDVGWALKRPLFDFIQGFTCFGDRSRGFFFRDVLVWFGQTIISHPIWFFILRLRMILWLFFRNWSHRHRIDVLITLLNWHIRSGWFHDEWRINCW